MSQIPLTTDNRRTETGQASAPCAAPAAERPAPALNRAGPCRHDAAIEALIAGDDGLARRARILVAFPASPPSPPPLCWSRCPSSALSTRKGSELGRVGSCHPQSGNWRGHVVDEDARLCGRGRWVGAPRQWRLGCRRPASSGSFQDSRPCPSTSRSTATGRREGWGLTHWRDATTVKDDPKAVPRQEAAAGEEEARSVRAVLVGCGAMSEAWLGPVREIGVELTGLVDIDPEHARQRARQFAEERELGSKALWCLSD